MNKILTTLFAMTFISGGASPLAAISNNNDNVVSKNDHKANTNPTFNEWDLTTWGPSQKSIIVQSYLAKASSCYQSDQTWANWCAKGTKWMSDEETAVWHAFMKVNPFFDIFNVAYAYIPQVGGDLKQDLAQGVNLFMQVTPNDLGLKGWTRVVIQGNIG